MNGTVQNYLMLSQKDKDIKNVWLMWNYLKRAPKYTGKAEFNLFKKAKQKIKQSSKTKEIHHQMKTAMM